MNHVLNSSGFVRLIMIIVSIIKLGGVEHEHESWYKFGKANG